MKYLLCLLLTLSLIIIPIYVYGSGMQFQTGLASWYGKSMDGKITASGLKFRMNEFTAAHRSLDFGTKVKVSNLENGRTTHVIITDRGPFVEGRIIDLSHAAASSLGMVKKGVCRVMIEVIEK